MPRNENKNKKGRVKSRYIEEERVNEELGSAKETWRKSVPD